MAILFFAFDLKVSLFFGISIWGAYSFLRYNGLLPKKNIEGSHVFITGNRFYYYI